MAGESRPDSGYALAAAVAPELVKAVVGYELSGFAKPTAGSLASEEAASSMKRAVQTTQDSSSLQRHSQTPLATTASSIADACL